jgi:hypothetical protein
MPRAAAGGTSCEVGLFGERNDDEGILRYAAAQGRAFLTSDQGIHEIAHRWLCELVELKPEDVNTEGRVLRIVSGKGRKDRNVPPRCPSASPGRS